jgi:hypothetical protein
LIRENPVFFPPGKRPSWAGGWIPAFAGMTPFVVMNVAVYKMLKLSEDGVLYFPYNKCIREE